MLFYRAALPLSRTTLTYLSGVIRRHRRQISSAWRKLNPGQQALLVLVHLRKGETFAGLAAGFGVGTATAWRYVHETVALLAARAPKLDSSVRTQDWGRPDPCSVEHSDDGAVQVAFGRGTAGRTWHR
jgi:hypothetical protein